MEQMGKIKRFYRDDEQYDPMIVATRLLRNLSKRDVEAVLQIVNHYKKGGTPPKEDN